MTFHELLANLDIRKSMPMARFSKVSQERFFIDALSYVEKAWGKFEKDYTEKYKTIWDKIILPERATSASAGYDIRCPINLDVKPGEMYTIPTGLRCKMLPNFVAVVVPRSSLGFKYGMQLVNTVGIIDADYAMAENEGHILLKIKADKEFEIKTGDRIAQCIFLPYGITTYDSAATKRTGGIGSTGQ